MLPHSKIVCSTKHLHFLLVSNLTWTNFDKTLESREKLEFYQKERKEGRERNFAPMFGKVSEMRKNERCSIDVKKWIVSQCFPKSAPRNTSGPPDELKWSANQNTNKYFVVHGALKYFWWSAHRKSLGTTVVSQCAADAERLLFPLL